MYIVSNRRSFLQKSISWASLLPLASLTQPTLQYNSDKLDSNSFNNLSGEAFWKAVRANYDIPKDLLNLNNGGVSPHPNMVREGFEQYHRFSNQAPSHYMWKVLDKQRAALRRRLAQMFGAEEGEVAIQRNTTEALEAVIFGMQMKKGDEVILSRMDYPNMINAWKQRAHRDGITLQWVDLDLPSEDISYLVQQYQKMISRKTKVLHLTHLINWTGQIMPAQEITAMAHKHNIPVILDAAHTFGHFYFDIKDLNVDFMGTSLHKWLGAPFGTGLLYIKKDKIAQTYPLFGSPDPVSADITKFEHLGTRSFPTEHAITFAIDFHNMIGWERKYERLHSLKNYWMEAFEDHPRIQLKTSLDPQFGGAIGLFSIDGMSIRDTYTYLINKHRIHTSPIRWEGVEGIRVTPNVYTSHVDLDRFIEAIRSISA